MILFNVGYNRMQKEPFMLTMHGMEYDPETHEDKATFTLKELLKFIKALEDVKDNYILHLN